MRTIKGWQMLVAALMCFAAAAEARPWSVVAADVQRVEAEMKVCKAEMDAIDRQLNGPQTVVTIDTWDKYQRARTCYEKLGKKLSDLYRELRGGDPKDMAGPEERHGKEQAQRLLREVQAMQAAAQRAIAKLKQGEAKAKRK